MDFLRGPVAKWLLSAVYVGVWVGLSLLVPWGVGIWLVGIHVLYAAWIYLTADARYGQIMPIRPLTPWDVADYAAFRSQLRSACQQLGLRREPVWAVVEQDEPNAFAVSGRRGLVIFTTGLLRAFPAEELVAIAGHELCHIRSHDSLPAVVGGAWLLLVGQTSAWCQDAGRSYSGLVGFGFLLFALGLDLITMVMGYLAGAVLAKRSRTAEHLADWGGARVSSVSAMCASLERLEGLHPEGAARKTAPRWSPAWLQERLHASHPPTPERLAYLRQMEQGA